MFTSIGLRVFLIPSRSILRGGRPLCTAVPVSSWTSSPLTVSKAPGNVAFSQPARCYARGTTKRKAGPGSQLNDLRPEALKFDYASVPLAQTTDDLVKRLLSLELASHQEKLTVKKEQLIAKVQKDETDRNSMEVQIAILTTRIRNYEEHLHKHHKDMANKRRMLMAIDRRKKLLKKLRMVEYDSFEKVCKELDITYTFPPEYYRRLTRRFLAKKEFCKKLYLAVQEQKPKQKVTVKLSSSVTEPGKMDATVV